MDSLQIWKKNSELEIFTSKEPLKNHENLHAFIVLGLHCI